MRYFRFTATTPYAGTDSVQYEEFSDDVTEGELEEYAEDLARCNGESFDYLVFGWDADPVGEGEMTQEEYETIMDNYYADCLCSYEEVSEEEYEDEA